VIFAAKHVSRIVFECSILGWQKFGVSDKSNVKCYICGRMGHMQTESGTTQSGSEKPGKKIVSLEKSGGTTELTLKVNPFDMLLSDSEEESEVSLIRVASATGLKFSSSEHQSF